MKKIEKNKRRWIEEKREEVEEDEKRWKGVENDGRRKSKVKEDEMK